MDVEIILPILITAYLRKFLQTKTTLPKWHRVLSVIFYASIALLIVSATLGRWTSVAKWLGHALMIYLVYILFVEDVFRKARPILLAIAPFVLLLLVKDISQLMNINQNKTWKNLIDTALFFSVVWMFIMWLITNKQRKELEKERDRTKNEAEQKMLMESLKDQLEIQVQERTAELTQQKEELQHTLDELKSAQAQLIQAEKMASLGQLTAGIAHEIQNPLNFVNNFSDLNKEMLEELKEEISKPLEQRDDVLGNELITDLIKNSEKINFHGKRADNIVKSMLQHSRASSSTKEPTDINALCDEYLRLAFHGMRAKEKSFNSGMETVFDPSLDAAEDGSGKINMVPQDIGRVLLNLLTNAFYEVNEKRKESSEGYQPMVNVKTKRSQSNVLIEVTDNGRGIPESVRQKIFQPFFTTKPTGEGTGLGLSLSYDIVKAHGGELSVSSVPGESTTFKILLPIN